VIGECVHSRVPAALPLRFWITSEPLVAGQKLSVAVVGAGLIGCGIAYELAKRGCAVTVFDRAEPARAASWAGAGMLAPYSEATDDDAMLALCREALAVYPAFVEELHERVGVDAHFVHAGALHVALDALRLSELTARAEVYRKAGATVRVLDRTETLAREALVAGNVVGSLFIEDEAQVDNRRLGRALVAACVALGVHFERVDGIVVEADARRVRGLRTARGFVAAAVVVNAAGAWAGELAGVPEAARISVRPIAGEMIALAIPDGAMHGNVWLGHRYLVPRRDGRLLIGATMEERGYNTSVTAAGVRAMLDAALAVAPALAGAAVVETWAGLRPGSADARPYLGRTPLDGYVVAAGHFRNGILLTPLTAKLIAELVVNGDDGKLAEFALTREKGTRIATRV